MNPKLPLSPDQKHALLDELAQRHESQWALGYDRFPALIERLNLRRGVEVGVAFGGHSEAILKHTRVEQLIGVDSYRHRSDYADPMNLPQPVFDALYARTRDRLAPFGNRNLLMREESSQAADSFKDDELDFVYLDADHSEDGVFNDLCAWVPRVRIGGIIAGHDYGHRDFAGVQRAVDRYLSRLGWEVREEGCGVWWAMRTALPISYFIPCYNCEAWVEQAVGSIIAGNLAADDELILVNDGSTDGTGRILNDLAERYGVIRVIEHDSNRGGSAARNTAVAAARHKLCFCLDSDNVLATDSVPPLRRHLLRSGVDTVGFQEVRYFTGENGTDQVTHSLIYDDVVTDFTRYLATKRVPGASGNYLFTRESWERAGGYPEDAGALDAWGFGLRQTAAGCTMAVLPGSYYFHRHSHDSYWVRHARDGSIDSAALDVLRPYFDRLDPRDVRYLNTPHGQARWFAQLNERSIRPRREATVDDTPAGALGRLASRLRQALKRAA